MKIGVLTFVHTSSFGAVLQAYALSHYIAECGAECELIDYHCEAIARVHDPKKKLKVSSIKDLGLAPLLYKVYRKRMNKFIAFEKKNMSFSDKKYTPENIGCAAESYDIIVAGSDQVWNMDLTDGDTTFFLDFVKDKEKKCSYAASIGTEYFPPEVQKKCETYLEDFRKISVREEKTALQLQKYIKAEVDWDIDPTFLIAADTWKRFTGKCPETQDYILLYMIPEESALFTQIYRLAEQTGCKIVWIKPGVRGRKKIEVRNTLSPEDFLNYIYHAKYVITGSFHAVCFSIQFQKNLMAVAPSAKKRVARITSLLENLELQECMIWDYEKISDKRADYSRADKKLEKLREKSRRTVQSFCRGRDV